MFFQPTLNSHWFFVRKTSQYLMLILAIAMLAMPILTFEPPKAEAAVQIIGAAIIGGAALLVGGGTLARNLWMNAWIWCPKHKDDGSGCNVKVQRKNRNEHRDKCTRCKEFIWPCISETHLVMCEVCDDDYYDCPPDNQGRKRSQADQHGEGICNADPPNNNSTSQPDDEDTGVIINNSSGNNSSGNNSSGNNSSGNGSS